MENMFCFLWVSSANFTFLGGKHAQKDRITHSMKSITEKHVEHSLKTRKPCINPNDTE